jgi:hypothetical protein
VAVEALGETKRGTTTTTTTTITIVNEVLVTTATMPTSALSVVSLDISQIIVQQQDNNYD